MQSIVTEAEQTAFGWSADLAGMRNINAKAGGPTPTQIAVDAFNANYGTGLGRDFNAPVVNVTFTTLDKSNSMNSKGGASA